MKKIIVSAILSYLLGCVHLAHYFGKKVKNVDIRTTGSHNSGTANAIMVVGWRYGLMTLVFDVFKGFFAVYAARRFLTGALPVYINAFSVIMGHIFPVTMKFHGGKGVATLLGSSLGISTVLFACLLGVLVFVTLLTNYIAIGDAGAACTFASYAYYIHGLSVMFGLACIVMVVMIARHMENYRRIAAGGAGEVPIDFFIKQRGIKPDDLEDIDDFKNYKIK